MIRAEEVIKSYGQTVAVKNVSFGIGKGEIVGLLGPNGAGKTTLMKILTCYHYPQSGKVEIDGNDIFEEPEKIKSILGYLPENAPLYNDLNVYEYLDFISDARNIPIKEKKKRLEETIEACGVKNVLFKPIEQLSRGYRQRVGLAQAIIHNPEILILDEPTNGLDPNQIIEIRKLIETIGREKTVILSTHILREVEAVCNRIIILNRGEIVASGTTAEIGATLEGGSKLQVVLKGSPGENFARVLSAEHLEIKTRNDSETTTKLLIGGGEKEKAAETVFDAAVKNGLKILEMHAVEGSLEELFITLTAEKGGNDE